MGPLAGYRIIEFAGLGPAPFCAMLFADMGAEVICIQRRSAMAGEAAPLQISERGKKSIALNLKHPQALELVLQLIDSADALIEGFRPGVMERLGLGPEPCLERNPKLVYGRMTGWGQTGPLAMSAGHDINYISLSGALHSIGRRGEKPVPPLNLVGDFGGGSMFLGFGILSALLEVQKSGLGQVIDASMVEGSAALMAMIYSFRREGNWHDERGVNMLDGGAHFYDTYETRDGKYVSIGSIEPQFYSLLLDAAGLDKERFADQNDTDDWAAKTQLMETIFRQKTRDEWCAIMEGTDICFAPVLSMEEAPRHPHNVARQSFIELSGFSQPAPAPRFSRSSPAKPRPAVPYGSDNDDVLRDLGLDDAGIEALKASGAVL